MKLVKSLFVCLLLLCGLNGCESGTEINENSGQQIYNDIKGTYVGNIVIDNIPQKTKITISDDCVNLLKVLRGRQRIDQKLLFPSPITDGYRDPDAVTRKLHRMLKRAGLPDIRLMCVWRMSSCRARTMQTLVR